ncbi:MAG: aminotransferase class I/II-fold pyridoxal phosphate-dependent enzyme [Sphingobacteriaceae bacterium]
MSNTGNFIIARLKERQDNGLFRTLRRESGLIDFCSNDYLGFARSELLRNAIANAISKYPDYANGSTGSRLLAGNGLFIEELEKEIAQFHEAEAGLMFNSGYDANIGLFSALPQRGDTIITDELIHASIIDGARLSYANRFIFKHNNLDSLEQKLKHAKGNCYIAVESVYSMDGDVAPLEAMAKLSRVYNANLIVDEAHALGIFGSGMVQALQIEKEVFARVVTFGKALGAHGAIILGSNALRDYLINFARSFIYSTAPSFHQVLTVKMAYQLLKESTAVIKDLQRKIALFRSALTDRHFQLTNSNSAIQSLIIPGNEEVKMMAEKLRQAGFDVRPILSPTVAAGSERLRICLHSFNTEQQILSLTNDIIRFHQK